MGATIFTLIIVVLILLAFVNLKITSGVNEYTKKTWCSNCSKQLVAKNSGLCEECQLDEIAVSRMEGME